MKFLCHILPLHLSLRLAHSLNLSIIYKSFRAPTKFLCNLWLLQISLRLQRNHLDRLKDPSSIHSFHTPSIRARDLRGQIPRRNENSRYHPAGMSFVKALFKSFLATSSWACMAVMMDFEPNDWEFGVLVCGSRPEPMLMTSGFTDRSLRSP